MCEIQLPTTWSDTSVSFTINQGTFQQGETAYLFVIDSGGNVSNGYSVSFSG